MSLHAILSAGAALLALAATTAGAQQPPGPTVLVDHPLHGGAHWITGGRSNTGFIVGDTGVIAIDTQTTPDDGRKNLAEIAKVTPKPVNAVILTHSDPDHIGGLPAFPIGIPIITHENTRATILASAADPDEPAEYRPMYNEIIAHHLPTDTLAATEERTIDGVKLRLIYVAPAHSEGDIIIYVPKLRIVFGGDIILTNVGRFPVVHIGGSTKGWIQNMRAILALDADTFVPGHGPIENRAQLTARLKDVEQRREQVKAMVYAGKSLAEVEQALPEPGASPRFETFTQTVYHEIAKGYPPSVPAWANLIRH